MNTVFIGGSRHISRLPSQVIERIDNVMKSDHEVIIGDANGADKAVQKYLSDAAYDKVTVFCSGDHHRNNLGRWRTSCIAPPKGVSGFQFYAAKDREMAQRADFGLMIWDGKSPGTVLNVLRLIRLNKKAVLIDVKKNATSHIKSLEQWKDFLAQCSPELRADLKERATADEWQPTDNGGPVLEPDAAFVPEQRMLPNFEDLGSHNTHPTMNEILMGAPDILSELSGELLRRADEEYRKNQKSQLMACFYLAIRSASLLCGMAKLLTLQTRDSSEVLARGFLEARDLLMTFRFDQKGTRDKIGYWFEGKLDSSWKAEHRKCEEFMDKLGHTGTEFGKRWSMTTVLAHPTVFATQNSTVSASSWAGNPPRVEDFDAAMEPKIADYLTSIATLIVIATTDMPGLISLACDLGRMPNIDIFRQNVFNVAVPVLNKNRESDLPLKSYRT